MQRAREWINRAWCEPDRWFWVRPVSTASTNHESVSSVNHDTTGGNPVLNFRNFNMQLDFLVWPMHYPLTWRRPGLWADLTKVPPPITFLFIYSSPSKFAFPFWADVFIPGLGKVSRRCSSNQILPLVTSAANELWTETLKSRIAGLCCVHGKHVKPDAAVVSTRRSTDSAVHRQWSWCHS